MRTLWIVLLAAIAISLGSCRPKIDTLEELKGTEWRLIGYEVHPPMYCRSEQAHISDQFSLLYCPECHYVKFRETGDFDAQYAYPCESGFAIHESGMTSWNVLDPYTIVLGGGWDRNDRDTLNIRLNGDILKIIGEVSIVDTLYEATQTFRKVPQ